MKLSKITKEAIVAAAVKKAGIPEKMLAIKSRYAQWAEAVRVRYVTPEQAQLIEAAKAASNATDPKLRYYSFRVQKNNAIEYANIAGQRRTVYFCGALNSSDCSIKNEKYKIAPSHGVVTIEAGDPLAEILYSIDHDSSTLKSEIEQLTVSLWAVLNSVTTDKRLIEVWPEAIAFIPAAEKANAPQLPALPIASLNKLIGLP